MDNELPYLEVSGPDGQYFRVELELSKERITIGRFAQNDVALDPDPQHLISRKSHCNLEYIANYWWIVDNGSVNGTFVRRGTEIQAVRGRVQMYEGDTIRILGKLIEGGDPLYWELTFHDPFKTNAYRHTPTQLVPYLEYDWEQARLFRIIGTNREEIRNLSPHEHELIRYMYKRNRDNGNIPAMCSYKDLLDGIWGKESNKHGKEDIYGLIMEIRKKIGDDPKQPLFLEMVRGMGYRLIINIQP